MYLAKVSATGQITIPTEIRRALELKEGDKLLFLQRKNGEIVVENASASAISKAQKAFSGVAETMDLKDDADLQVLVDEMRYGKDQS
ncbi:MAG: AbrB/MazE/SpoVT family DNA-binding domain-containing protein [Eubacteriales bacterium]|nr:AbrB/MazE/SpoVT family DNA-binding domain-containing protein [Eubacteriales bacterium]